MFFVYLLACFFCFCFYFDLILILIRYQSGLYNMFFSICQRYGVVCNVTQTLLSSPHLNLFFNSLSNMTSLSSLFRAFSLKVWMNINKGLIKKYSYR